MVDDYSFALGRLKPSDFCNIKVNLGFRSLGGIKINISPFGVKSTIPLCSGRQLQQYAHSAQYVELSVPAEKSV